MHYVLEMYAPPFFGWLVVIELTDSSFLISVATGEYEDRIRGLLIL